MAPARLTHAVLIDVAGAPDPSTAAPIMAAAERRDAFVRDVPAGTVVEVDAHHHGINTHPDSVAAIEAFLARPAPRPHAGAAW